jgi:hypothetical protein
MRPSAHALAQTSRDAPRQTWGVTPFWQGDGVEPNESERLSISCDECVMRDTVACDDCIVSFLVNREPGDAVVVDADAHRDLELLTQAGLVPGLQHRRRVS